MSMSNSKRLTTLHTAEINDLYGVFSLSLEEGANKTAIIMSSQVRAPKLLSDNYLIVSIASFCRQ
jgi:hypothetical protein